MLNYLVGIKKNSKNLPPHSLKKTSKKRRGVVPPTKTRKCRPATKIPGVQADRPERNETKRSFGSTSRGGTNSWLIFFLRRSWVGWWQQKGTLKNPGRAHTPKSQNCGSKAVWIGQIQMNCRLIIAIKPPVGQPKWWWIGFGCLPPNARSIEVWELFSNLPRYW